MLLIFGTTLENATCHYQFLYKVSSIKKKNPRPNISKELQLNHDEIKKHMQNTVGTYEPEDLHGKNTLFVTPSLILLNCVCPDTNWQGRYNPQKEKN